MCDGKVYDGVMLVGGIVGFLYSWDVVVDRDVGKECVKDHLVGRGHHMFVVKVEWKAGDLGHQGW